MSSITAEDAKDNPSYKQGVPRLLYKADEVVRMTGFSRAFIYQLMASGTLPSVRCGRSVRIPAKGLEQWIERQTV